MGSLLKMPKYEPPAAIDTANKAIEEREKRAEAGEKNERRKLASRARARRKGGRLLFSDENNVPALGVTNNMSPSDSINRNPMDTGSRYT
tara:strand:+ start:86 stop:355 length:270 start_codon:yes stop_codon:yes gene_type:complete